MACKRLPRSLIYILCLISSGVFLNQASAQDSQFAEPETVGQDRNQQIRNLNTAGSPVFLANNSPDAEQVANTILFTFSAGNLVYGLDFTNNTRKTTIAPEKNVSRVAIAFGHEGWGVLHPLQKTKSNLSPVFFLYYSLDRSTQQRLLASGMPIEYRYIVDGVWMADPMNQANIRKINGALISVLDLRNAPPAPVISPEFLPLKRLSTSRLVNSSPEIATSAALAGSRQARTVILRWIGESGQDVYVAGTFNHFDPYQTPLAIEGNDPRHPSRSVYAVELRLLAGQYYYHFVINGKNCLDDLNLRHGYSTEGIAYSQLQVP